MTEQIIVTSKSFIIASALYHDSNKGRDNMKNGKILSVYNYRSKFMQTNKAKYFFFTIKTNLNTNNTSDINIFFIYKLTRKWNNITE